MGHLSVEITKKRKQYENKTNKIVNSRASVWTLEDLRPVHQQDHIKAKDQIAIRNEYAGLPSTACYSLVLLYRLS